MKKELMEKKEEGKNLEERKRRVKINMIGGAENLESLGATEQFARMAHPVVRERCSASHRDEKHQQEVFQEEVSFLN